MSDEAMFPADLAMEVDRKWFDTHPHRKVYVRERIEGEFAPPVFEEHPEMKFVNITPATAVMQFASIKVSEDARKQAAASHGMQGYTLVIQAAQGFRSRLPVYAKPMSRQVRRRLNDYAATTMFMDQLPIQVLEFIACLLELETNV